MVLLKDLEPTYLSVQIVQKYELPALGLFEL